MNVLSILIKTIAVFDLIVIAVYFGGDIFSTVLGKFRKKPVQKDDFEFYDEDTADVPLSIDSIRLLCSGDVTDFVKEQLLPGAAKTMDALVESERTAVLLLLSALIGFLKEEGRMDEQNFPMVMELLNHAESRYTLVVEASKRGREIVNGALPMIDAEGMKPLKIAVEEINRGLLTYDKPVEQEEQN